jgi:DNA-binding CsgD family transcriptional regulator/PAS domain-containing protein
MPPVPARTVGCQRSAENQPTPGPVDCVNSCPVHPCLVFYVRRRSTEEDDVKTVANGSRAFTKATRSHKTNSTRQVLDAIPGFAFLMDDDVNILEYNAVAEKILRGERRGILRRRGGDVLHCVHSHDAPGGCGRGKQCKRCLLRRAVNRAVTGAQSVRKRVRMQLEDGRRKPRELYILVSAAPLRLQGKKQALVILEDVAELMRLRNLMPICMSCKRVRIARKVWKDVGSFLQRDLDMLLDISYCPDCSSSQTEMADLQKRAALLTPREQEVFRLVVRGLLNKQVAAELGTAEHTVKLHRAEVMKKMEMQSLASLVRAAVRLGVGAKPEPPPS